MSPPSVKKHARKGEAAVVNRGSFVGLPPTAIIRTLLKNNHFKSSSVEIEYDRFVTYI
jgi:hypothetical protein